MSFSTILGHIWDGRQAARASDDNRTADEVGPIRQDGWRPKARVAMVYAASPVDLHSFIFKNSCWTRLIFSFSQSWSNPNGMNTKVCTFTGTKSRQEWSKLQTNLAIHPVQYRCQVKLIGCSFCVRSSSCILGSVFASASWRLSTVKLESGCELLHLKGYDALLSTLGDEKSWKADGQTCLSTYGTFKNAVLGRYSASWIRA